MRAALAVIWEVLRLMWEARNEPDEVEIAERDAAGEGWNGRRWVRQ